MVRRYTLAGMEALKNVSDEDQAQQIGRAVVGIRGDVSKMADLDRVFAQIKQEAGRQDIVFANAGIAKNCGSRKPRSV